VLEGWLPASERDRMERDLAARHGAAVVVEDVASEQWTARDVPVAISNPPLFRPFEVITGRLPSPRYGTIDPTPFVAVFFPAFFGLILGDVGYGTMLAALATFGWWRSRAGTTLRSVSQIAATCALFSILFGLLFGELFGDLGHRVFDMHALTFSREEAVVPFLILALAVGFVHMLLGLVLGALSSLRSDPRESLGRGLTALMLLLTVAILLAAVNALPQAFFVPSVVVLLLTFPVLILVEGVVAPIEFLSRISNVLSYARIMALGTASVMLALVANQMVGIFGGAVVGVLFATLFHLVNFALGVFSPTIHALRLHFVEFYGTFYSPGGLVYRPFRHWNPLDSSLSRVT
jgi:V/A-type H+-transporting ATPase subunit I